MSFSTALVIEGLELLCGEYFATKIEQEKDEDKQVMQICDKYDKRRELLAHYFSDNAKRLEKGEKLTSKQLNLTDSNYVVCILSPDEYKNHRNYYNSDVIDLASIEHEEQEIDKIQRASKLSHKKWKAANTALSIMSEFTSKEVSQTAWRRLGLDVRLLGLAVRTAHERRAKSDNKTESSSAN